jgi:ABC-type multidrug transport system fused ATPase/permease subunit
MDGGHVAERGTFDALVAGGATFAALIAQYVTTQKQELGIAADGDGSDDGDGSGDADGGDGNTAPLASVSLRRNRSDSAALEQEMDMLTRRLTADAEASRSRALSESTTTSMTTTTTLTAARSASGAGAAAAAPSTTLATQSVSMGAANTTGDVAIEASKKHDANSGDDGELNGGVSSVSGDPVASKKAARAARAAVAHADAVDAGENLVTEETRESGRVSSHIFLNYLDSMGGGSAAFLILLGIFVAEGNSTVNTLWMIWWSDNEFDEGNSFYLSYFGLLALSLAFLVFLRGVVFAVLTNRASREQHERMLHKVMRAPCTFFDVTPVGRIVNRFSKDIHSVDMELPHVALNSVAIFSKIFASLGLTAFFMPWFLIPVAVCRFHHVRKRQQSLTFFNSLIPSFLRSSYPPCQVGSITFAKGNYHSLFFVPSFLRSSNPPYKASCCLPSSRTSSSSSPLRCGDLRRRRRRLCIRTTPRRSPARRRFARLATTLVSLRSSLTKPTPIRRRSCCQTRQ